MSTRRKIVCCLLGFALSVGSLPFTSRPAEAQTSQRETTGPDIKAVLQEVLRVHPDLILGVLEHNPLVLADLVDRGTEIRKAKAEEAQWQAELAHPKVPQVAEDRPIRGARQAPVTIVEYSDF